ncbi:MAG: polyprenyl synthetase family protein [Bacteroidota bacterium]
MTDTILSASDLRKSFLNKLSEQKYPSEPKGLYEPVDYILQIGGKRVRPVLALLGAQLFGADPEEAMPAAMAVEIFHNFTLLHDDIMDASPLRRGQATVHEKWDINTGILSGDLMLIKAYESLARTPRSSALPDMLQVFNQVATGVCEGQQYDVDFETRDQVSIDEYLKMIELKTAVLLGGALQLGALAAGADAKSAQELYEFGRLTGVAFQLQDDLLDIFGTEDQIGKAVGNDIVRNKKTFLYLKALESGSQETQAELRQFYATTPADSANKVARVTELMRQLSIPEAVAELRDSMQRDAYAQLDATGASAERQAPIRELTESLLKRQH